MNNNIKIGIITKQPRVLQDLFFSENIKLKTRNFEATINFPQVSALGFYLLAWKNVLLSLFYYGERGLEQRELVSGRK